MMALAGRPVGLDELHGDGVSILRKRTHTETRGPSRTVDRTN
jgi:hypothetical protein